MRGLLRRCVPIMFALCVLSACSWDDDKTTTSTATLRGNLAPNIVGSPATSVVSGADYLFAVAASDPEGAKLTFTIANKPAWASFDSISGVLSGKPIDSDVGGYANITIAVSDGANTVNLAPFAIQVMAPTAGSAAVQGGTATLSWQPPTLRVDGTPLAGLAGFKVHVGQLSRGYSRVIDIAGAAITRYTVAELGPGTWFFAVSAYDESGAVSGLSVEVSKTFR